MIPTFSSKEVLVCEQLVAREEAYGLELVRASPGLRRASIYVILRRMEDKGLVTSRYLKNAPNSPPRRYFRLTGEGARAFRAWTAACVAAEGVFAR